MQISIIAVGSELLLGQIANTNGQYLSKLFNDIGHSVVEHTVVGDNADRLARVVKYALDNYDAVVLTGGLGPTKDDLTKHTVAQLLNRKLVTDHNAMNYIEQFFAQHQQVMTPNNKQQALVIEGSKVLENKVGMAPGMLVHYDDKKVVLLPGPPKEMQPMAKNELLPYFLEGENSIYSESLRFAGIGESRVETELMDLIDNQSNPTIAPLAGTHEVNIRLTANANSKAECIALIAPIKQEILRRLGAYYYGSNKITLAEAFMQEMTQSFALYDGVTDGLLYSRMNDYNSDELLQGILIHAPQFIDSTAPITNQLTVATTIVQKLYNTQIGIVVLSHQDKVYIGILKDQQLHIESFNVATQQVKLKTRTPNQVLIRLLNYVKNTLN